MKRHALARLGVPALTVAVLIGIAAPVRAQGSRGGGHGGGGGGRSGGSAGRPVGGAGHTSGAVGRAMGGMRPLPHLAGGGVGRGIRGGAASSYAGGGGWQPGSTVAGPSFAGSFGPAFAGGFAGFYPAYDAGYGEAPAYDNSYFLNPFRDLDQAGGAPTSVAVASPAPEAELLPAPTPRQPRPAFLTVRVPADAEVWFDDTKMTQTGPVRLFQTPPLQPKEEYSYQVRARWTANGQVVDQTHTIDFRAGQTILVDFLTPPRQVPDRR